MPKPNRFYCVAALQELLDSTINAGYYAVSYFLFFCIYAYRAEVIVGLLPFFEELGVRDRVYHLTRLVVNTTCTLNGFLIDQRKINHS